MNKKYVDEEMMVMHESAQTLFEMGIISAAEMREFDADCLVPAAEMARKP
jgi:DNA-binding transcriptional regulator YiaG